MRLSVASVSHLRAQQGGSKHANAQCTSYVCPSPDPPGAHVLPGQSEGVSTRSSARTGLPSQAVSSLVEL